MSIRPALHLVLFYFLERAQRAANSRSRSGAPWMFYTFAFSITTRCIRSLSDGSSWPPRPRARPCRRSSKSKHFFFLFFSSLIITFTFQLNSWEVLPSRSSSGQAVVTGVFPSPRYMRAFIFGRVAYRVQHPHCSSIFIAVANSRFRAFRYSVFMQEEVLPGLERTKLIMVGKRTTFEKPPGTPAF